MTAGHLLNVRYSNIPTELTERKQWVVWKAELNPRGKFDKIPHNARDGKRASSTDVNTWSSFEDALDCYTSDTETWAGIGFVLTDGDGLVGIDLDDCFDPETRTFICENAKSIVQNVGSYTETSPSGTGVKLIVKADVEKAYIDSARQIEIYPAKRFFTITGHTVADVPDNVISAQEAVDELVSTFPVRSSAGNLYDGYQARKVPTEWILQKASNAINGDKFKSLWAGNYTEVEPGWSASEADAALMSMLAFWTGPDREWLADIFRESGLYREKFDRDDYRESTIELAIEGLDDWYDWYPLTSNANGRHSENGGSISLEDFVAYMPKHDYIFIPSREHWPSTSINSRFKPVQIGLDDNGDPIMVKPNIWLDQNKAVEQITWAPGMPLVIQDRLMSYAGWIKRDGVRIFNQYRAPSLRVGEGDASPWIDHIKRVYPDDWQHLVFWMAQRVQRPGVKINHALVLGGTQGIGKDSILEPLRHCIGAWNFSDISPANVLGNFNDFAKSVVLRISEARDLGDTDRYKFYEHLKIYTASPPDVLRVNEKYANEYYVMNCCGVIITTNHMEGGLYLPAEDRRHYVAWSDVKQSDFEDAYWKDLWTWYDKGGYSKVHGYLRSIDLSTFDPKAPPPKTPAFWDIVSSSSAPEDAELSDVIEKLGHPEVITVTDLVSRSDWSLEEYLTNRKNSRKIPHRLRDAGYVRVRNLDAKDGLWRAHGKRQVVYGRMDLSDSERLKAVRKAHGGY